MEKRYYLFLNGEGYGNGSLQYINQLISDYILGKGLHNKRSCEFEIVEDVRRQYLGDAGESTHLQFTIGNNYLFKELDEYTHMYLGDNGKWYLVHSDEFYEWGY